MVQRFNLSITDNPYRFSKVCRNLAICVGIYMLTGQILCPASVYAQNNSDSDLVLKWVANGSKSTNDVAWGDMDGDGDLDLATGNNESNSIYRNDGNDIFTEVKIDNAPKYYTLSIAWGDMDGDGHLDLAAGNSGINYIYHNNGNSEFTPFALPGEWTNTRSIAWGDMDGDGDLDLAAGTDKINLIYRNENNSPEFTPLPLDLEAEAKSTMSVAWGDMDGDGDLDLAAGNGSGSNGEEEFNILYRNDGNGNFMTIVLPGSERNTMSVAWGDMDSDGDLELAVANGTNDKPELDQIYRNEGNGNFVPIDLSEKLKIGRDIAWSDMDMDGDLDLAIAGKESKHSSNGYQILRNDPKDNGKEVFTPLEPVIYSSAPDINSISWGDMDSDGDFDLAIAGDRFNQIYANTQVVSLQPMLTIQTDIIPYRSNAVWGDMEGDGNLDLAIGGGAPYASEGGANSIYRINGSGKFSEINIDSESTEENTRSLAWGDMDNDGDLDLVAGNGINAANRADANAIYCYTGNGKFTKVFIELDTDALNTVSIALGDVDNDGDLDIAAGNRIIFTSTNIMTKTNILYLNDSKRNDGETSDCKFDFKAKPLEEPAKARVTSSVAWGDMDNDGDLDLAVGNQNFWGSGPSQIYRNDGDGNLTAFDIANEMNNTNDVAWGDMDNDGDLDLAFGNNGVNRIYRNDGDGIFVPFVFSAIEANTVNVDWIDINNDGYLDLVTQFSQINSHIYINNKNNSFTLNQLPDDLDFSLVTAWGDFDNDGDLDLASINSAGIFLYKNSLYESRLLPNASPIIKVYPPNTTPVAAFYAVPTIFSNSKITFSYSISDPESDPVGRVDAFYSFNGGGHWLPAVPTSETIRTNLATAITTQVTLMSDIPDNNGISTTLEFSETGSIEELEITFAISHPVSSQLSAELISPWPAPTGTNILLFNDIGGNRPGFNQLVLSDRSKHSLDDVKVSHYYQNTPIIGDYRPQMPLSVLRDAPLDTPLTLVISDTVTGQTGTVEKIILKSIGRQYNYVWDTFASGFYGQSDNVVMRFVAYNHPLTTTQVATGTFLYVNSTGGSHQRSYVSSTTFPFRVRGTQVQVVDDSGNPVSGAKVYRIPARQSVSGKLIGNGDTAFQTDGQGYLLGRGTLDIDDQLLALAPQPLPINTTMQWAVGLTDTIHLYYTNGIVTETGVTATISNTNSPAVTQSGVQVLQVSKDHPLLLFDLRVALEWDASTDPNKVYLSQLQADLQKAAEFLYDFTNGQATLGHITVTQNAEDWMFSDVVIKATNRLRPLAVQGGIVVTATPDFDSSLGITYTPGQVIMGSTWSRYGTAGQNLGYDWPLALAHELSHYLFFLDDTYLGKNTQGLLIPVDSCQGSVMGDMYNPSGANTEFIKELNVWQQTCANTLAYRPGITEWGMILQRYPMLNDTNILTGPSQMPFQFTQITITTPLTPTPTLADPIFFLDYPPSNQVSSTSSRAYLIRDGQYLFELGTAIGGQNRLLARGAQERDTLCVFDPQANAADCEEVNGNNERLTLRSLSTWQPQIAIHPVNTTTLNIQVEFPNTPPYTPTGNLAVRIFPTLNKVTQAIPLVWDGSIYSATAPFVITYTLVYTLDTVERSEVFTVPIASGHLELWEDTDSTDGLTPKMDTNRAMVAFAIGGNFGNDPKLWAIGPHIRAAGPHIRAAGPHIRAAGTFQRSSNAPVASSDGQLIFFIEDAGILKEGDLYSVQSVASFPQLPNNTEIVGSVYHFIASLSSQMITGSVSFQYLGSDALALGITEADEQALMIYHCCNQDGKWQQLPTVINIPYNLASTFSKGSGFYALLARVRRPQIVLPKSRELLSSKTIEIQGKNFKADTQLLLIDCHGVSQIIQPTKIEDDRIEIDLKEFPDGTYTVFIVKDNRVSQKPDALTIGYPPTNCP